jgi:aminoglycoside phosphotransferase (APT) family kinase protein
LPATAEEIRILADLERELARETAGEVTAVAGLAPFGDGHSGFTYSTRIERGGRWETCVLRLSPPRARITGPAIASLAGLVPVPAVIACASEPVVAARAYMLLERVEGTSVEVAARPDREVAGLAIEVLRALHAVEPRGEAGEAVLSPSAEVERWVALLPRTPAVVQRRCERLAAALLAAPPPPARACRVHGDFHYGNLLFDAGRVVAVLDWELASIGPSLGDLGSLIVASVRRRYAPEPNSMGNLAVTPAELIELYGAPPATARWYAAAACLKYAAIIGFNYELHRTGRREDPEYALLGRTMRELPGDGLEILRRDG